MRTHPALRNWPSSESDWIGVPSPRSGMPWNPMASDFPHAKRVMYGRRSVPPFALDMVDLENTR